MSGRIRRKAIVRRDIDHGTQRISMETEPLGFPGPDPGLVFGVCEPPRNTAPIQRLVSGLLLAPEHPMPRARNLAGCPLAE